MFNSDADTRFLFLRFKQDLAASAFRLQQLADQLPEETRVLLAGEDTGRWTWDDALALRIVDKRTPAQIAAAMAWALSGLKSWAITDARGAFAEFGNDGLMERYFEQSQPPYGSAVVAVHFKYSDKVAPSRRLMEAMGPGARLVFSMTDGAIFFGDVDNARALHDRDPRAMSMFRAVVGATSCGDGFKGPWVSHIAWERTDIRDFAAIPPSDEAPEDGQLQ